MSDDLFAELLGILHEEELLKFRRRCQMQKKPLLGAILTGELRQREDIQKAQHGNTNIGRIQRAESTGSESGH